MRTILICAYVIQSHLLFSASSLCLKKYGFTVPTFWTSMIFRSRQRWIRNNVRYNMRQLTENGSSDYGYVQFTQLFIYLLYFVHDLVYINAIWVSLLLIVTIPARVQQNFAILIFFGVQHVITRKYENFYEIALYIVTKLLAKLPFLTEPNSHKSRAIIVSCIVSGHIYFSFVCR